MLRQRNDLKKAVDEPRQVKLSQNGILTISEPTGKTSLIRLMNSNKNLPGG
jgi:hypothetical protein